MNKLIGLLRLRDFGRRRDVGRVRGDEHRARRGQVLGTVFRHAELEPASGAIRALPIAVVVAPFG
jgi:hypothetical protein